ncbi:hypothetical protein AJ80_06527 [Polytolypa hystricis UAMH7299]|uniref:Cytochrome P450 n=1 Tax=Polytolypa hystricis (strain UAMH7299) TaxID=1447883 RepID=A0A2B7XWB7_POLH7|nr:hypothetical protein AJ80_06527 [Polytolypa hystricis UAMH7299]
MLSSVASVVPMGGGRLWLWIPILLALPFLSTWILSNINARRSRNGEPPLIPYTIPWLGLGLFLAKDVTGFGVWVRKKYPNQDVLTAVVAGQHFYVVLDPKLVALIYRRPKFFTFEPFVVLAGRIFGSSKHDLDILKMGTRGVKHGPDYHDDGKRLAWELHAQLPLHLEGPNLVCMVSKFVETLYANLDKEFPKGQGASGQWVTLDLCEFVKRHMTMASIPSLYGSRIVDMWPRLYEDFWEFDAVMQILLLDLPDVLLPTAAARRKLMLQKLIEWEDQASKYKSIEEIEAEDPDWDEYWGARLLRARYRAAAKNGISKAGRGPFQLGLIWGQNANAIPVGVWMALQCVLDSDLQRRARSEISTCRNPDGTFDVNGLVTKPLLKSLFLEALRFAVASPSLRVVLETTEIGGYTFHKGNQILVPGRQLQMEKSVWAPNDSLVDPAEFWAERFLDLEKDDHGDAERVAEALEANAEYEATSGAAKPATTTNTDTSSGRARPKISTDAMALPSSSKSREIRERMLSLRPFGGGVTLCPGRHFAMYEAIATLAVMLFDYDIEIDQEALARVGIPQPDIFKVGGMGPDRAMAVRMRRR